MKSFKCKTCQYREKRPEGTYCQELHYYPNTKIIIAMGCCKYKRAIKEISLLNEL